ncbi:hypothetical protein [Mycolicibacterium mengxianglii]|nr:hypothetical protein [Mycolicibacterium mengxianglii]
MVLHDCGLAGAFVYTSGAAADRGLADLGTFVGALCFLATALLLVPRD